MRSEPDGIVTLARRLCWRRWLEQMEDHPRSGLCRDAHFEIERLVGRRFENAEEARTAVLDAVASIPNESTQAEYVEEERELLLATIRFWTIMDARDVEPLPYCRTLSPIECDDVDQLLESTWGIKTVTWALDADQDPGRLWDAPDVRVYEDLWLQYLVPQQTLCAILGEHGVDHIFVLDYQDYGYEVELAGLEFREREPETYFQVRFDESHWTDQSGEWFITWGMDNAAGVGGAWLIDRLLQVAPDLRNHRYRSWVFEPPPTQN